MARMCQAHFSQVESPVFLTTERPTLRMTVIDQDRQTDWQTDGCTADGRISMIPIGIRFPRNGASSTWKTFVYTPSVVFVGYKTTQIVKYILFIQSLCHFSTTTKAIF